MRRGNGSEPSSARTLARMPVRLAVAGLVVLAFTAACGTVPASGTGSHPTGVTTTSHHGPPWQTRAGSEQIATRLLAKLRLPAGALRLPQRPLPSQLRRPGSAMAAKDYVDRYQLNRLPMSVTAALRYLRAHAPSGMTLQGAGRSSSGGVIEHDLTFVPRKTPWGIESLNLTDTVVRGPGGHALLRSDAQVIWYPARSAAEHLIAADFSSVRITAFVAGVATHTVVRTFASAAVIARLVALLNSQPASPRQVVFCPLITVTYRLAFRPVAGHPAVVVSRYGCTGDSITVGGVAQPVLADLGKLPALVDRLLHLRQPVLRQPVSPHTASR